MKLIKNSDFLTIVSDLFINLSAGWFGAIIILPNLFNLKSILNLAVLLTNLLFGIISILIAFKLKIVAKKYV